MRLPRWLKRDKSLAAVPQGVGGGWVRVLESYAGAWQQNVTVDRNNVFSNPANFACKTLIASDIAKLRIKLVRQEKNIWVETSNPAYSPVLRKPNVYQTRIQFLENWVLSKLSYGNTYVLKERDNRNVVVAMYVLDPKLVMPLVSDDGQVFYQLSQDNLAGLESGVMVPASEIIHDRYNCLFHPLVGLSPIFANGVAATQSLNIQNNSATFFGNKSTPSGIITAAGAISQDTADRMKASWEANYSGKNSGKVAVLGGDLKFQSIAENAVDSQLIEQLKWTAEIICSTYHVPPYKVGVGTLPATQNVQSWNVEYFSQALQRLIEDIEECLDIGLNLPSDIGLELDLENLLRMDTATQMDVLDKGKNIFTPDEARQKLNLPSKPGGDAVYRQQQDFSIEALAKRDAMDDPFSTSSKTSSRVETVADAVDPAKDVASEKMLEQLQIMIFEKDLREALDA